MVFDRDDDMKIVLPLFFIFILNSYIWASILFYWFFCACGPGDSRYNLAQSINLIDYYFIKKSRLRDYAFFKKGSG